jgi:uncharacterized protein
MNSAPSYLKQIGGMIFIMLFMLTTVYAASFDCGKAASEVERMICGDTELSKLMKRSKRGDQKWVKSRLGSYMSA